MHRPSASACGHSARAIVSPTPADLHNTAALGTILYTRYVLLFQVAGLILLVAMIGAIVLTLRDRRAVRRQNIGQQIARQPAGTLVMTKVAIGAGIEGTGILRPLPPSAPEPVPGEGGAVPHAAEDH